MIRISKLTDYGFVVLSRFADHEPGAVVNARDLSEATGIPLPTVSKVLKMLARSRLVVAHRGVHGGYMLSRGVEEITAADVLVALEGPVAITDCGTKEGAAGCDLESDCRLKGHWQVITEVVRSALSQITLAQLAIPVAEPSGSPGSTQSCEGDMCRGGVDACGCGSHDRFKDIGVSK